MFKNRKEFEEALIKAVESDLESLEKAASKNSLHRVFKDLAHHGDRVNVFHVDKDLKPSTTPHPDGLIGYDVDYAASKKNNIERALDMHGTHAHRSAFGEDYSMGDDGSGEQRHTYGVLQLHPERQMHSKPTGGLDYTKSIDKNITPVREPVVGSMNAYEGSHTGEGYAIPARWQGSDPRHTKAAEERFMPSETRAGNQAAQQDTLDAYERPRPSKTSRLTSGVSELGYSRTETGKPVKLRR